MIELRQLSKTYRSHGQDFYALQDINLTLQRGEIFGVFGRSGAGKSTLLRCVNLLEHPTGGHVFIDNVDLTKLPASLLRRQRHKIGMIFQHFNLLESRTAFENIALPLELVGTPKKEIQKRVSLLLELVHLSDRGNHLPSQLSGGQKQRVAIARALATEPTLLLCDEATSALDPESTNSVLKLLKEINRKLHLTILLITHELEVIKQICGRAGVLERGRFIEQGSTLDIFLNPKTTVTQKLVRKAFHLEEIPPITEHLHPMDPSEKSLMVRLTFVGEDSDSPLITSLVKKFGVTVNIHQASIDKVQNTTIGFTVCQISGKHSAVDKALRYIQSTSVKVEVLDHA